MGTPQFDSSITHLDLRKIVPNVRHAIMWSSQLWREINPQIKRIARGCPRFYLQIGVPILP